MKLTRQQRVRLAFMLVAIGVFFVVVAGRLVHLQVAEASRDSEIVRRQSEGKVAIPAARGRVYDRQGRVVVDNIVLSSLYAYPRDHKQVREIGSYLDRIYGLKAGASIKRYGLQPGRFRWIQRRLSDDRADYLTETAPQGLYLRQEEQRSYPFGLVGKQIVGFTDIDNVGQSGLELVYDSVLAGLQGWADIRRDGLRNALRVNEKALVKSVPGKSMVLTVDWRLQEIVEEELRAGVEKYNAKSAQAVFIDCNSGEILAMAHYDPSEPHPERPTKLRAISDQYEPGSVFKVFTAAGVLDAGLIDFADSIYCEQGKWRIGRRTLHDDKKHGWLGFRRVVELSSNIGTAKCAIKLGGERLFETARRFGIGQKIRIGLPGETAGRLVEPERWSDFTVGALAMGHAVAVNSLQMAAGFGAIANGGDLLRPNLILGYVDDDGYVVDRCRREMIGQALTPRSADTLRAILRGVVEHGTAEPVNSPMISIAGKTGTAEIPDLENHRYHKNRFIGSFAGFFPAERPLVAGIVVMEEPHPIHYGGWTSGPAFRKIAERYSILNPDFFTVPERTLVEDGCESHHTVEVPDLVGREFTQALAMAGESGVTLRTGAEQGYIVWQFPPPDRLIFEGDEVLVAVRPPEETKARMVDLKGLSIRDASVFLKFLGVEYEIDGNGRVVRQSVAPGKEIDDKAGCKLKCRPA